MKIDHLYYYFLDHPLKITFVNLISAQLSRRVNLVVKNNILVENTDSI